MSDGMFTQVTETFAATGSLALLGDGRAILGFPADSKASPDARAAQAAKVDAWLATGGTLVLPFPVDVDDQREAGV